jgi:hypothetical protein
MKKISIIIMFLLLVMILATGIIGCDGRTSPPPVTTDTVMPGAEASSLIPTQNNTFDVGSLAKQWNDGWFGGTLTVATMSTTTGTFTTLTATNLRATTANFTTIGTYGGGLTIAGATINTATIASPAISSPTITGTGTIIATSANVSTLGTVSDALTITATVFAGNPNFTGTPTFANQASGISSNFTAGSGTGVVVTHGLASTPTRIYLSYAGDPGATAPALYPSSVNGTSFTVSVSANITNGCQVYWLAYIADE